MQGKLKLSGHSQWLLPGFATQRVRVTLSSAGQRFHTLQILETFFTFIPWSKRLVFPGNQIN